MMYNEKKLGITFSMRMPTISILMQAKIYLFLTLLLTILFLGAMNAEAASVYYVRAGASGANNGSDWSNAYTTLPTTLVRGSSYYIAGGSYGSRTFSDSGTSIITIKGAIASDHGTDTGWGSSYGVDVTPAVWTGWVFSASYYYIDGQVGGGPTNWSAGHGFRVVSSSGSYRILLNSNTSNITVRHTEITDNDISNYADLIYCYSSISYITFSYCYIHHVYGCCIQNGNGAVNNVTIEYSKVGDNNGTSANHSEIWSRQGGNNWTWRFNYIYSWRSTGLMYATGPGSNGTGATNVSQNIYIYGNIFDQGGTTSNWNIAAYNDGSYDYQYASGWLIANNTFINVAVSGDSWVYAIFLSTTTGAQSNLLYNNIWYGNSAGMEIHVTTDDYNSYQGSGQYFTGAHDSTLTSSPFISYSGANYQLSAPLAGGSLPSPFNVSPFNQDMYGNIRGADGVWDRGAYEYTLGTPLVRPSAPILH